MMAGHLSECYLHVQIASRAAMTPKILGPKFKFLTTGNLRIKKLGKKSDLFAVFKFFAKILILTALLLETLKVANFQTFMIWVEILGPKLRVLTTGNLSITKLDKSQNFQPCIIFWPKFWFMTALHLETISHFLGILSRVDIVGPKFRVNLGI